MRTSNGLDRIERALEKGEVARDVLVERGTGYIASIEILQAGLTNYQVRAYRNVDGEQYEGWSTLPYRHTDEALAIALGSAVNELQSQVAQLRLDEAEYDRREQEE